MAKRVHYWAVAWGGTEYRDSTREEPVIRYAGPCGNAMRAKVEAYGMATDDMTALETPGNPRYMSHKSKMEFIDRLTDFHRKRGAKLRREYEKKMGLIPDASDAPGESVTGVGLPDIKNSDSVADSPGTCAAADDELTPFMDDMRKYEWI